MHKRHHAPQRRRIPQRGLALICALYLLLPTGCAVDLPGASQRAEDDLLVTEGAVPLLALKGGLGALALPLFGAAVVAGGVVLVYIAWSRGDARRAFAEEIEYTTLLIDTARRLPSDPAHPDVLATWEVAAAKLEAGIRRAKTDKAHFKQAVNASLNERLARLAHPRLNDDEATALHPVRMQQRIVAQLAPAFDDTWRSLVEDRCYST